MTVKLYKSRNGTHKFMAVFSNSKTVRFGRKGYSDYTIHKDKNRMERYLTRHKKRENWGRNGKYSAGFWSRWLLWSKPSFQAALRQTQSVLGEKIVFTK
jgi:Family of unknown function (DUF5754)